MIARNAVPARALRQALAKRWPKPREDSGLTTLEWLLIVAAVAGLAALAVVLVTNVVGDTSEQIAGNSARKTAAQLAAEELMRDAGRNTGAQPDNAKTYADWADYYTTKCDRFRITYSDIPDITVEARFTFVTPLATDDTVESASITVGTVGATQLATTTAGFPAVAHCRIP